MVALPLSIMVARLSGELSGKAPYKYTEALRHLRFQALHLSYEWPNTSVMPHRAQGTCGNWLGIYVEPQVIPPTGLNKPVNSISAFKMGQDISHLAS